MSRRPLTVLAVDDQPENLIVVKAALEPMGYEVATADRAAAGYQLAVSQQPGLALLDVMMPGESGIELCSRLRQDSRTKAIPIVLLTALSAERSRTRGLLAGADDYLEKPIDIDQLTERVRSLIALGTRRTSPRDATRRRGRGAAKRGGETPLASLALAAATEIGAAGNQVIASAMARAAGIQVSEDPPLVGNVRD